ncbi:hypothetical protein JX265_001233 [Neoarthrinium moseri]|uniref:Histone acetyltransferase n=1 Tax=Neoarthrinium moseri TaxID=1658444 RepID=A0A9P9WXB9_9PEZI|nr:hypothetical protein JX265_001233 [Neoarthrinium moseri]
MANAQVAQEELQQSVVLSDEDAEYEEDDLPEAMDLDKAPTGQLHHDLGDDDAPADPDEEPSEANQSGGHVGEVNVALQPQGVAEEDDEDAEGELDDEEDGNAENGAPKPHHTSVHDGDENSDEDAEGEEDDMLPPANHNEEAEGVGAVKIRPGETDEDESESDADASAASDASDRESTEWEAEAENDNEEDDGESEAAEPNLCLFCKKDEENDPSEDFESYLTCKGCGEHSHQQCARDADAVDSETVVANWKCPECAGDDSLSDSGAESAPEDVDANGEVGDGEISPASRRSTASKLARDLLPSQRGVNKPDSHSVFNQLVLDEDPMDGSRVLRKRKTSSAEAETEEVMSLLRKRRRTTPEESTHDDEGSEDKADEASEAARPRSSRSLRLKISNPAAKCTILKKSRSSLLLRMRVPPTELAAILSQEPKPKKRPNRSATVRPARSAANATITIADAPMASLMPSSYTQPFYSFYDKETDDLKGRPYGGILTEAEADTSKTLPTKDDRRRFDEAKQKADEEWRQRLLAMQAEVEVPTKKSKKATGPASQIECIEFGGWEIDTWYAAPYPEEYSRNRVLYICEFCLKYMNSDYVAWRHKLKCPAKHPPGDEIYRQGSISFFEVDGRKNPVYCQNLCLLAKLFLGSKTLYYDVEPFLFYVLCEYDDMGYHFVGYFSKEKRASSQNNVSCILTLPIHQRKGYGNLLIDFSYLLTRAEEKTGSPEKPLSDMGLVSYRNYWRLVMCKYLLEHTPEDKYPRKGLSIRQISDDTGMMPDDVVSALEGLRCLVRDPQTKLYAFRVDIPFCREYVGKWESKNYVKLNDRALTWTPYVMGRSNATNFELGPALNAIAPREDDEDNKTVQLLAQSGIATGDFADANGINQKPLLESDATVLESTEPNDNAMSEPVVEVKTNGIDKENDEPMLDVDVQENEQSAAPVDDEDDWQAAYSDVPIIRFEVFPPPDRKRPGLSRLTSSIARPTAIRAPATAPRPRPRRSMGSSRKSASRPKSSSSRRKTGGTGRGPGRWPKGTKKSDYGNADSGPGLPPSWLQRQKQKLDAGEIDQVDADVDADADADDTVQVKQPRGKSGKGKEIDVISAKFEAKDDELEPAEKPDPWV